MNKHKGTTIKTESVDSFRDETMSHASFGDVGMDEGIRRHTVLVRLSWMTIRTSLHQV